jgi:hypothetical protein
MLVGLQSSQFTCLEGMLLFRLHPREPLQHKIRLGAFSSSTSPLQVPPDLCLYCSLPGLCNCKLNCSETNVRRNTPSILCVASPWLEVSYPLAYVNWVRCYDTAKVSASLYDVQVPKNVQHEHHLNLAQQCFSNTSNAEERPPAPPVPTKPAPRMRPTNAVGPCSVDCGVILFQSQLAIPLIWRYCHMNTWHGMFGGRYCPDALEACAYLQFSHTQLA